MFQVSVLFSRFFSFFYRAHVFFTCTFCVRLMRVGRSMSTGFLDFIAPPACAYCQRYLEKRAVLCAGCLSRIQPVVSFMVPCTKTFSMTVFAAASYKEPMRSLIVAKRWSNIVSSMQLGELIWEKTYFKYAAADYLVPVPLHWSRQAWRG
ncbi:hypothetical protein CVU75_03215, partial [Candidatus Dependentiae bacterium HGW-Dependentiae-1]